jgi:Family of unknown function (DUF5372)
MVTYPFHPLVGQTVLITGVHEHDGVCHYLIRQSDGGHFHLPDWMIDPAAGQVKILRQSRRLYGCGPLKGAFSQPAQGARACRCTDASDVQLNGEEHTPGNVKL